MKRVLVTGAAGFMGTNLVAALRRHDDVSVQAIDVESDEAQLEAALVAADVVYHLAGINRPETSEEFERGNAELTRTMVRSLEQAGRAPIVVFSSSIQAALDNPYGRSKKGAEEALLAFHRRTGAPVCIYRLPNVFGKWSRPNYNTVVATFCHNIARGLDITISDPNRELELVYIDDVVRQFLSHLDLPADPTRQRFTVARTFRVTLADLVDRIGQLRAIQQTLVVPDLADEFTRCLYATYLSFVPPAELARSVELRTDARGWLFELIKSPHFGQVFVSATEPGVTRGNHYHDTKIEKFCIIVGDAVIRFRHVHTGETIECSVSGQDIKLVDIPPGYSHSVENVGSGVMIGLFWANEVFSPDQPDTYAYEVQT